MSKEEKLIIPQPTINTGERMFLEQEFNAQLKSKGIVLDDEQRYDALMDFIEQYMNGNYFPEIDPDIWKDETGARV